MHSVIGHRLGLVAGHECHHAGVFSPPCLTEIHDKTTGELVPFSQV